MTTKITTESSSILSSSSNISALHATRQKIRGFKELKRGWNYGEGIPIEQSILNGAFALNREAIRFGFLETDAFPGLNGEVMFTIYSNDHYLEFTLESDGSVTFYHERGNEEISYQEGLSFQDAKEKIQQFRIERWMESDFLTEGITTTPEEGDLTVLHSRTSETIPVFQSSVPSAFSRPEEASVNMSNSIINWLQTIPQFSGASRQTYYLTVSG